MAINILKEKLVSLRDVPAWLESKGYVNSHGKPFTLRLVQRWAEQGLLETTPRVVSIRYTSEEAIARMLAGETLPRVNRQTETVPARQGGCGRSHEEATENLRRKGVLG